MSFPTILPSGWTERCCVARICQQARPSKCDECCWNNRQAWSSFTPSTSLVKYVSFFWSYILFPQDMACYCVHFHFSTFLDYTLGETSYTNSWFMNEWFKLRAYWLSIYYSSQRLPECILWKHICMLLRFKNHGLPDVC